MNIASTVHTSGIDWASVITMVSSVVVIMSLVLAVIGKFIANKITSAIDGFRIEVIAKLDTRITILEQAALAADKWRDSRR